MVHRKVPETPLQLITVGDDAEGIACARLIGWQEGLGGRPLRLSLRAGVADSHEEAIGPALVLRWITQTADVTPDVEERLLGHVLGQAPVAQDPLCHREQSRIVGGRQCLEGALVAVLNPNHEVLVHAPTSLGPTTVRVVGEERVRSGPL